MGLISDKCCCGLLSIRDGAVLVHELIAVIVRYNLMLLLLVAYNTD